ncbi:CCDC66 domain-containing protein [Trichonephila clavipes]|uniref:CCDC66 domain-containing protein n=1 Tax=Trichonephila clavipes TaxID=2585209 RepID=A0A8X7BDB0_TRICX|nr:CCDC66 domain-containing protein [Trichonephila clavipes]
MVRPPGGESRQLPIAEVKPDSWDHGSPEKSPKNDTVTLTKSQFQQILEAIGQSTDDEASLRDLSPSAHKSAQPCTFLAQTFDTRIIGYGGQEAAEATGGVSDVVLNGSEKIFTCHDNPEYFPIENNPETVHESEIGNEAKQNGNTDLTTATKESCNQLKVPCPLDVVISCPASPSWSAPQTVVSPSKLSPLSKIEQKRLQWEKERAEMIDWNPWGKPGAGAPAKKTQVVAPITSRTNNQLLMVQTSGAMPYTNSVPSAIPSCLPSPNCRILPNTLDHSTFLPNNYTSVAQSVKPVPPVFKSSIAFGNIENELVSSDSFKREQWLRELDYQREEQRRYQEQIQMSQMAESHWKEDTESISVSVDGSVVPGASDMHRRSYMRGQGFSLDPVSAALAEERRMKAQEYQQAIRMQMEEKQRRQQAERERKKQEEEAEEKRLEAERARMQAEYEEEQLRLKQKAEMEEKKHQALVSAVQQAQVQAEMEKKSRKIQKLLPVQSGNQETSAKKSDQIESLSNCMESQLKMENNIESSKMEQSNFSSQQNNKNKENSSLVESDCESIDKKELGVQTMPVSDREKSSVYVVDRVLTPSIFRVRERAGCAREFGTQTDIHYGKYTREDAESTESNTSSFHSPVAKRIVRVQHSKPYKAQRRPQCIENAPPGERPKWGVNQPSKSYVRMTERDPHFSKRKKMQELRKQHWARELAAQKTNESSRKSILSSYPSLRGRRAASSSDCTLGYSSSEFETRKTKTGYSKEKYGTVECKHASSNAIALKSIVQMVWCALNLTRIKV